MSGFTRRIKPLEILAAEEIEGIHRASMRILQRAGVRFAARWALELLERNGCQVDYEERRVRFPQELVEECLRLAPRTFRARARDPEKDIILGEDTVHFTHSAGMQTIDLETFEPRDPTRQEYIECVTVLDALPTVTHLSCYPYFGYAGVPPEMGIPESVAMKMRYSTKHQFTCYQKGSEVFTIQMAQACGLETTGTVTASPPLLWADDALQVVKRNIEAGFPLATVDGYTLGATGPVTVAGEVALANAHHLSLITLVQLMSPGHRISVGHFASVLNMSTGSPVFGEVGAIMSNMAWNQTWRRYCIPFSNGSPGYVSSKVIDYQAGYEKALGAIMAALTGAHYILFHLGVSGEMTAHPLQAILDDDVAGIIGRILQGEEVNGDTLPLELIEEVGPLPGHYLDKDHTRLWWRLSQYMPRSADRNTYPDWLHGGKKTAMELARERMEKILATHRPQPLTPAQEADIERILSEARTSLAGR